MANEYVSQIQLPNNEIYDIKDKNAVKDITSSDIPGNINFTKGEETKDVLVKDFGLAYGVDLYKDQLPIEVTSPGGTAADWVIYGNDDNGTENLFDKSNAEMKGHFYPTSNSIAAYYSIGSITVPCEPLKTYTIKKFQSTRFQAFTTSEYPVSNGNRSDVVADNTATSLSITSRSNDHYLTVYLWSNSTDTLTYDDIINTVVVVQGSIAPDHYIPYQQGVGERTGNLFDIGTSASDYVGASIGVEIDGYNLSMNIVAAGGTWTYRNKKILTTGEHTVSLSSDKTYPRVYIALRNQDDSGWLTDSDASISGFLYNSYYHGWFKDVSHITGNVAISVIIPSCLYWQIGFGYNSIAANVGTIGTLSNIMLVEGSTAPDHYIPHGYQIPLTISQQGETDKSYNIYIGDSPLTEGETVSKTSTGVDIELFEGENTVLTTLYNKPEMEIKPTNSTYNLIEQVKTNKEDILSLHLNITDNTSTTNTTTALTNGNVYLRFKGNKNNDLHKISGTGGTTVTTDTNANILINSPSVSLSNGTITINNNTITPLTSHQSVTDNNPTLSWGTKSKVATIGSTEINVTMPSNPNTDRYVNSASFAHDSTNNNVKMTLTRAGSDTSTVTANIPLISSSTAGVAPKGATVSSQSQSTKFLREDGTWAAPSYTTNTNTWRNIKVNGTEKLGTGTGTGALDFINGINTTVSYTATGKIAINATDTDTKVTQKNSSTNSYRSLLFGCSTIDNENPYDAADITDYVYRSANLYARTSDGALYCTSDINIQSSNLDRDVTPSEEQIGARFSLRDKDNDRCAALYAMNTIDNAKVLVMSAYNNDGTKPNTLKLSVNNDGTCSYYVTSPSAFRKALDYAAYFDGTTTSGRVVVTSGTGGKVQASSYTIEKSVPGNAVFTDTDTKVTSVSNHYAPAEDSNANLTASASGATAAWSIDVVKGITLKRDAKGHVVGISVTSGKIPANPNTDEKVKTNLIVTEGDDFPVYYLTATGNTNESAKQLYMNDNAIIRIQTGTASITGRARLVLGNNTAEGAADNCCGQLQLYSTDNGYSVLRQATGVSSTGITIYLPPKAGTIFNTGNLVAGDNITLTQSDGVYSINGTANTDTKVTVTETDPTTKTTYYPVWRGAHSTGTGGVLVNEDFKYNSQLGTASEVGQAAILLGNSINSGTAGNKFGQIVLFAEKSGYMVLKYKASSTSNTTQTFPDTTGTVLNTGTTSISRSLTSGTKIATLTINGTDTDLYCQTNTDTHRPIKLKGNAYLGNSSTAVDFLQGSNITLSGGTGDNIGKITIAATNNKTSQTKWDDAGGTNKPLLMGNGFSNSTAGTYYIDNLYCSGSGVLHCQSCIEGSDKRLKDNIEILDNRYLELIKKLQPRRYKFKNDIENKYHIGFITQEIETELSKCNLTKEDFGTLTETGEDKMQGLAYTDFIPMLLLYIKDLEKQIKEIKEQQ